MKKSIKIIAEYATYFLIGVVGSIMTAGTAMTAFDLFHPDK